MAKATKQSFVFLAGLVAAIVAALFLPGLSGNFIFDDTPNIVTNASLHIKSLNLEDLRFAAYSFQPGHGSRSLSMLSFALDFWRGNGLNPFVFKTTNLFIHGVTVICVAFLTLRLFSVLPTCAPHARAMACLAATAWGAHPLQVSSVLYVVQRMQTLSTMFTVLALWTYLGMRHAQIRNERSSRFMLMTLVFLLLGFAAKEDSVLLPLYTFLLEITVLGFAASAPKTEKLLRGLYAALISAAILIYMFWIVPHFWTDLPYPGRDFNTLERLLSQGRALITYLRQILLPFPSSLHFYYDDFQPSRGLFEPWTTGPALLLLTALLVWAWLWRRRNPLFAFGILFFFAGHFVTSNVIGLELAFEHRNHLPLLGIVLSAGALLYTFKQKAGFNEKTFFGIGICVVVLLGTSTMLRARVWGNPQTFAEKLVRDAPNSERAWVQLAGYYSDRNDGHPSKSDVNRAISVAEEGAARTHSVTLLTNIVIYKTIEGTVSESDWNRLLDRLKNVPMSVQNRNVVWVLLNNEDAGMQLDRSKVTDAIEIVTDRWSFDWYESLLIGSYLFRNSDDPSKARPFFERAAELAPPNEPAISKLIWELNAMKREEWARDIELLRRD